MQSIEPTSVPLCRGPQTSRFSQRQTRTLPAWFVFLLPLVGVLLSSTNLLHGQTVTFPGTSVNFGNVNVCAPGQLAPAPCTETMTLNFKVTAGGALGTPTVLTMGAPNLDFTLAGSTCTGSVSTGSQCSVMAKLTPRFAGLRAGAVRITDGSGNVLATVFVHGVGVGAQVEIAGPSPFTVLSSPNLNMQWSGLAVDGAGDVFVVNGGRSYDGAAVFEVPAGGGPVKTVGFNLDDPVSVALDGAGDLFITEFDPSIVVEVPAGCENVSCQITLSGVFSSPRGIAVDGAGNVYITASALGPVTEIPAGCRSFSCQLTLGSATGSVYGVAVDGDGNLYIGDNYYHRVVKLAAVGGKETVVASSLPLTYGLAVDAAGDLFIPDNANGRILEVPVGIGFATTTVYSGLLAPVGVALDAAGNLFFTSSGHNIGVAEIQRNPVPGHAFATTVPGTVSGDSPQAYTLSNSGNAALSLSDLSVGTDGNFTQAAGPGTLSDCVADRSYVPGASCNLSLSFTPTVNGPLTGAAVLTDNAQSVTGGTQMIPLSGTGGPTGASISFPNGFTSAASGLALNGGASVNGSALQLTDGGLNESRSVFSAIPIGLASFATEFDFQLTGKDAAAPDADGFMFVVQANGPNAVGSTGGGLGYGAPAVGQPGPAISNSVGIKFDLHDNNGEGQSSTGVYLDGAAPTTPSLNLLPSLIDLHSGHVFHVALVYDGKVLTLTITDQTTHAMFSHPFTVNMVGYLGGQTGYAGFTASTGAKTAVQNILDWQLTSSECCTAGEPAFTAGFSSPSELTLNGNAGISNGALLLTQDTAMETSSAFFPTTVPVNIFTSDFDFKLSAGYGEGFAFVLQSIGFNALGSGESGLGYGPTVPGGGGAKIAHSVAVKFDLHSDEGEGSNSTGVYVDGASPTVPYTEVTPAINLHSGHTFHARLTYTSKILSIVITDLTQYAVFAGSYPVDIPKAVGSTSGYAGFTASTGDLYDTIKILNWSMTSY